MRRHETIPNGSDILINAFVEKESVHRLLLNDRQRSEASRYAIRALDLLDRKDVIGFTSKILHRFTIQDDRWNLDQLNAARIMFPTIPFAKIGSESLQALYVDSVDKIKESQNLPQAVDALLYAGQVIAPFLEDTPEARRNISLAWQNTLGSITIDTPSESINARLLRISSEIGQEPLKTASDAPVTEIVFEKRTPTTIAARYELVAELYNAGVLQSKIAELTGVSEGQISADVNALIEEGTVIKRPTARQASEIKKEVIVALKESGMKQKDISKVVFISEAGVSQALSGKSGHRERQSGELFPPLTVDQITVLEQLRLTPDYTYEQIASLLGLEKNDVRYIASQLRERGLIEKRRVKSSRHVERRRRKVLAMKKRGMAHKDIADELEVAPSTITSDVQALIASELL